MPTDFSVGGVVTDPNGRVALIRTTSLKGDLVWGLPKGHPKVGEAALAAAVREATRAITTTKLTKLPCSTRSKREPDSRTRTSAPRSILPSPDADPGRVA